MKILWKSCENLVEVYGGPSSSPKTQILERVTASSFLNANTNNTSTRVPGAEHSGHFRTAITQTKTNIKNHDFLCKSCGNFMRILLWESYENFMEIQVCFKNTAEGQQKEAGDNT